MCIRDRITSALESSIGLNSIAQYTFTKKPKIPQGLGTGGLFTNNFDSMLSLVNDMPVSYTHLDVYKRQQSFRIPF